MSYSMLEWLWEGTKCFPSLKRINLGHSTSLMQMPDLSEAPEIERIVLEGCLSLPEIDSSIQHLKKLVVLNLRGCVKIKKLPNLADLECLEILNLAEGSSGGSFWVWNPTASPTIFPMLSLAQPLGPGLSGPSSIINSVVGQA
ncbi:Disease resistance protein RPP2A [Linum perenne]